MSSAISDMGCGKYIISSRYPARSSTVVSSKDPAAHATAAADASSLQLLLIKTGLTTGSLQDTQRLFRESMIL